MQFTQNKITLFRRVDNFHFVRIHRCLCKLSACMDKSKQYSKGNFYWLIYSLMPRLLRGRKVEPGTHSYMRKNFQKRVSVNALSHVVRSRTEQHTFIGSILNCRSGLLGLSVANGIKESTTNHFLGICMA